MGDQSKIDVEEGQEVVRNTIVGGRPMARKKRKVSVPIGIEKFLLRAAADAGLRRRLFEDRSAVIAAAGDELSASERSILESVPDAALAAMMERLDLKTHTTRPFARKVAAAAFATAALGAVVIAGTACTGIDPDLPDGVEDASQQIEVEIEDTAGSRGAVPDEVLLVPDGVQDSED
jgi:hypothetical protein